MMLLEHFLMSCNQYEEETLGHEAGQEMPVSEPQGRSKRQLRKASGKRLGTFSNILQKIPQNLIGHLGNNSTI